MTSNGDTAHAHLHLGTDTRISSVDLTLARSLGYEGPDLHGQPFSTLVSPPDIAAVGRAMVSIINRDQPQATVTAKLVGVGDTDADPAPTIDAVLTIESHLDNTNLVGFTVTAAVGQPDTENPSPTPSDLPEHLMRLQVCAGLLDTDGNVVCTNETWQQFFVPGSPPPRDPTSPSAMAATTAAPALLDIISPEDRTSFEQRLTPLLAGLTTSLRTEERCLAAHGNVWCRIAITEIRGDKRTFAITIEDISAEHLTNRVLLANEQLFRSLAEASPIGLARLAPDLSITYSNPGWRALTGEAEGEPLLDIGAVIHTGMRSIGLAEIENRILHNSDDPVRIRLSIDTASPRWASLRIASVTDPDIGVVGHVATIEDVTELIRSNESDSRLAGVVETTTDLVGIGDLRTGTLTYLNRAAEQLFVPDGFREGLPISALYAAEEWERYKDDVLPVLARGEAWTGEVSMLRHDGSPVRVLQTIAAEIGEDGIPERASVLGRDVTQERRTLDELAYKATHDFLTGLPNRSLLVDHIDLALARAERDDRPVGLLFIDLDRFKAINDTYGHDTGDLLLQEVAQRMSSVLRPSDTVARLGGDEFVILCEDIDGELDALTIAGRVRAALESEPIRIDGKPMDISASVGIALSTTSSARNADALLQRADTAMYRAKNSGRARTELFDDVLRDRNRRRSEQTDQLAKAIADQAMELHYQPIVDLHTGKITAAEAFMRWNHPTAGMLYPRDFLQLAVDTNLVQSLDDFAVRQACQDAKGWLDQFGSEAPLIHVNVSGNSLLDEAFPGMLEAHLNATDLPAAQLCVELGEPFLMGNGEVLRRRLDQLRSLGVAVAIDDVGTSATVLPLLGGYELSVLKVDAALTTNIITSEEAQQLFAGVAALGKALGLRVGAESVEHRDALPLLATLGAQVAQGHVFAPPVPAARLTPLLPQRSRLV